MPLRKMPLRKMRSVGLNKKEGKKEETCDDKYNDALKYKKAFIPLFVIAILAVIIILIIVYVKKPEDCQKCDSNSICDYNATTCKDYCPTCPTCPTIDQAYCDDNFPATEEYCNTAYPCDETTCDQAYCEANYPATEEYCNTTYPCNETTCDADYCEANYPCDETTCDADYCEANYPCDACDSCCPGCDPCDYNSSNCNTYCDTYCPGCNSCCSECPGCDPCDEAACAQFITQSSCNDAYPCTYDADTCADLINANCATCCPGCDACDSCCPAPASLSYPWGNADTQLIYNGVYPVKLVGISMTTTEYMLRVSSDQTFYNLANNCNNQNLTDLANLIHTINTPGGTLNNLGVDNINKVPLIRIPLTASYWLNGSNEHTGREYANAIINIIAKINDICDKSIVIILDLHWNYTTETGNDCDFTHCGGTDDQQPMALNTNTLDFWNDIVYTFGIRDGKEVQQTTYSNTDNVENGTDYILDPTIKNNIFFELYNEPFLEGDGRVTNIMDVFINGNDRYTGMLEIYQTIRKVCDNMVIISGAEQYAWFQSYGRYYLTNNNPSCFTQLYYAIQKKNGGDINDPKDGKNMYNVMLNIHPYTNSKTKMPGFYDYSYIGNDYVNSSSLVLGNMLLALTENTAPDYSNQMVAVNFQYPYFPIIATEFGQYGVPWCNYPNGNIVASNYSGTFYGGDPYTGQYSTTALYSTPTPAPALIGYLENFEDFNVSYCFWAARPNTNFEACQPDAMTNGSNNGTFRLINSDDMGNNQCTNGNQHASGNFQYIFDTYMITK